MSLTDEVKCKSDESPRTIRMEIVSPPFNVRETLLRGGITIGLGIALYLIQKTLSDPDYIKFLKMKILANISSYADRRAAFWHSITERATNAYLQETSYGKR